MDHFSLMNFFLLFHDSYYIQAVTIFCSLILYIIITLYIKIVLDNEPPFRPPLRLWTFKRYDTRFGVGYPKLKFKKVHVSFDF